jgi:hypothetical protein
MGAKKRPLPLKVRSPLPSGADIDSEELESGLAVLGRFGFHGRGDFIRGKLLGRRLVGAGVGHLLSLFERVDLAAHGGVLIGQVFQSARDIVQFVEAAQHFRATVFHPARGFSGFHGADRVAGATGAHNPSLIVHDRNGDAAIHPAGFVGLAVSRLLAGILRIHFAAGAGDNLARAGAVLDQKILNRSGARQAQLFVERHAANYVRMTFNSNLVTGVAFQQVGHSQQARITVHEHG